MTELDKTMQRVKHRLVKSDAEVLQHERALTAISKVTGEMKAEIETYLKKPEQGLFSFMPTSMTRISPFFPLSKRDMKDRPFEKLEWETSWGRISFSGERLAVYDETVLLTCLLLVRKHKSGTFQTTRHEICQLMAVKPATDTYNAIWASLDRLTRAGISLELWESKKTKGKRKRKMAMSNTILSGAKMDDRFGKILVTVNPYFVSMYGESFITNIDLKFRAKLAGDVSKIMYRFYESQRDNPYQCHLFTLAKAINLDVTMETFRLRARVRQGLRELRKQKYLKRWTLNKNDTVTAWRA